MTQAFVVSLDIDENESPEDTEARIEETLSSNFVVVSVNAWDAPTRQSPIQEQLSDAINRLS